MQVTVDKHAGFCFGVERAIELAEKELAEHGELICLEDLVHNREEMDRLRSAGLTVVSKQDLSSLPGHKVLLRAHGEPPDTYETARNNNITLLDATCPIVIRLQSKIKKLYEQTHDTGVQIVIFGKHGHPEVVGLKGNTNDTAIIVTHEDDFSGIDFGKPIHLFSQTTMSAEAYQEVADKILERMKTSGNQALTVHRSFCRQVSGRTASLRSFAQDHDIVIFVSDSKSSNGKYLFSVCQEVNPRSFFIYNPKEVQREWFSGIRKVGVTGATSTPSWLMNAVKEKIEELEME